MVSDDFFFMRRALLLARYGFGRVAPNPVVGAVVVYEGKVIGEGYHAEFGGAHAEVVALNGVSDADYLPFSTLYVTLEPCSHWGKTPPCVSLIIEKKINRVVVGTLDPFHLVAGRGVRMLREAGIEVVVGCLEEECRQVAKEFFCMIEQERPYIILKWAQSADGFIDHLRSQTNRVAAQISTESGRVAVHKLRAACAAILVGTQTAIADNPSLTTRYFYGANPLRIVLDRHLRIPQTYHLFDDTTPTLVVTECFRTSSAMTTYLQITFDDKMLDTLLSHLYRMGIQSLLVEGGAKVHQSFIDRKLYDEVCIERSDISFGSGVRAAQFSRGA